MFDSHCHLHDARVGDASAQIAAAKAAGVMRMLLAGVDASGWRDQARLVKAHAALYSSYGVHPQIVALRSDEECDRELQALSDALGKNPAERVVALGEIGLDAVGERKESLARQERVFAAQLELARARNLPVCLHILRAHGDALRVLRRVGIGAKGGVVHSYSGSAELVAEYSALGLSISFAGSVTWPGARRAVAAARVTPLDRLLVETDAPDQTPTAHRPGANEPAFLVEIIDAIAQIRRDEVDRATLARLTDENACRLFGVTP